MQNIATNHSALFAELFSTSTVCNCIVVPATWHFILFKVITFTLLLGKDSVTFHCNMFEVENSPKMLFVTESN